MHRRPPHPPRIGDRCPPSSNCRGLALIFVLAMLVLILGVVLAFFSQAANLRKSSATRAAVATSPFLTDVALNTILNDFKLEMEAGSENPAERPLRPRLLDKNLSQVGQLFRLAPSMVPQASGVNRSDLPNVVKISRTNAPFFPAGNATNGFNGTSGPNRASGVSTATPSRNGRSIPSDDTFWNKPGLMTSSETASFVSPDWIYLDRSGNTPTTISANASSRAIDSDERVMGRFAYVVYDVGGLLDVNVAGNGFGNSTANGIDNSRRGRLHQVDPTGIIPGITDFSDLVNWRWSSTATDFEKASYLNAPKTNFAEVPAGNQALLGRQDLLAFTTRFGGVSSDATPFLTTFSRAVDAPHWRPDDTRPVTKQFDNDGKIDKDGNVSAQSRVVYDPSEDPIFNPDVLGDTVRFAASTVLTRGADPDLEVPIGSPVMPRRFPLSKLSLLADPDPDEDSIKYYFGLEKSFEQDADGNPTTTWNGAWQYQEEKQAADGRIRTLQDVVAQGREPNFFEVLQAGILAGSLGKNDGNSYTLDELRDSKRWLQILQIGANIIDQWDSDSIPTTVRYPVGASLQPLEVYGTENIPYFAQLGTTSYRPFYNGNDTTYGNFFQVWGLFSVWNPHQNIVDPTTQATSYRIRPLSGVFSYVEVRYAGGGSISAAGGFPRFGGIDDTREDRVVKLNKTSSSGSTEPLVNRSLEFSPSSTQGFDEVSVVGAQEPTSLEDTPGVLLWQEDLADTSLLVVNPSSYPLSNAAVPPLGSRPASMQDVLNKQIDLPAPGNAGKPFSVKNGAYTLMGEGSGTHTGAWRFNKPASPITPTPQDNIFWEYVDDATYYYIRAKYSVKAHNQIRTFGPSHPGEQSPDYPFNASGTGDVNPKLPLHPDQTPTFVLEGQFSGVWKPIQRIDNYFRRRPGSGGKGIRRHYKDGDMSANAEAYYQQDTHHSAVSNSDLTKLGNLDLSEGTTVPGSFYKWQESPDQTLTKPDPRTQRFGMLDTTGGTSGSVFGKPLTRNRNEWSGTSDDTLQLRGQPSTEDTRGMTWWIPPNPRHPLQSLGSVSFVGFMTNNPDVPAPNGFHTVIYQDLDRVIRPADGYYGGNSGVRPMMPDQFIDRPIVLNRPFTSPAELGYVFRDQPWKSLDFFSRFSADLGLLDLFSVDESDEQTPVVAGKVSLNTRRPEIIQAVLSGAAQQLGDVRPAIVGPIQIGGSGPTLPANKAIIDPATVATGIVAETTLNPISYAGDLVPRILGKEIPGTPADVLAGVQTKTEREAAIRTLAGIGNTRTWNFMIDLVVQTGSFPPQVTEARDFVVSAQRRAWIHVAMDRMTGEVVATEREWVDE